MVILLKSWEEGLLTHIDSSAGSREGEEGTHENGRGPMKMEGDRER